MNTPYPHDIRPLTVLRFFAAWVVVCYHIIYLIDSYYPVSVLNGVPMHAVILPYIQKGYLAVDFFFILSGFVLAHVYQNAMGLPGAARHFYIRRLARIYPLHIMMLIVFLIYGAIGWIVQFSPGALLSHIFLVQAWGNDGFWARAYNGPSWSISAEWMAYLLFPLLLPIIKGMEPARALVRATLIMVAISTVCFLLFGHYVSDQVTWCFFRVVPEFSFGIALYQFFKNRSPVTKPDLIMGFCGIAIVIALSLRVPDIFLLLIFGIVIVAAADYSRLPGSRGFLTSGCWVYLGEICYSVYMIHYPLMVLVLGGTLQMVGLAGYRDVYPYAVAGYMALLIILSGASYRWFETPLRRYINARSGKFSGMNTNI